MELTLIGLIFKWALIGAPLSIAFVSVMSHLKEGRITNCTESWNVTFFIVGLVALIGGFLFPMRTPIYSEPKVFEVVYLPSAVAVQTDTKLEFFENEETIQLFKDGKIAPRKIKLNNLFGMHTMSSTDYPVRE